MRNYNLLFVGPPASAKTLFLLGISESKNTSSSSYQYIKVCIYLQCYQVYLIDSVDNVIEGDCQVPRATQSCELTIGWWVGDQVWVDEPTDKRV